MAEIAEVAVLNSANKILSASLALWAAVSAVAGDVSITKSDSEDKGRGEGMWRKRVGALFDTAFIGYEGVHKSGSSDLIQGKYGDRRLGLEWPTKRGGWNWSLDSFLSVIVSNGRTNFDGTGRYILEDARTLEEGNSAMAEFVWPLVAASVVDGVEISRLKVRVLHDPAYKEWLFLRISVEGGDATLKDLGLVCYPSSSSGPPERERWILAPGGHYKMNNNWNAPLSLSSEIAGIAYHNKYQQTRDGCFLVFQPNEVTEVKVVGTYSVGTTIVMKPGKKTAVLALGYFLDTPWEDAGRMFLAETLSQVSAQFDRIDWSPALPLAEFDALIGRTGKLLAEPAPWPETVIPVTPSITATRSASAKRFSDLKAAYEQAKTKKSLDGMLSAVRDAAALRRKTSEDALKIIE